MKAIGVGLAAVLLAGCAAKQPEGEGGMPNLAGSLQVEVERDTAWLTLHVTNATTSPLVLEYRSAQRYDFEVRTRGGERLWRWSEERQFAQVVGEERVEAGATARHRVGWVPAKAGEYVAIARLTSSSHPLELSTPFVVEQRQPGP